MLYYEAKVTVEPIFNYDLNELAQSYNFKVGKRTYSVVVMEAQDDSLEELKYRTKKLLDALNYNGFTIRRYRIKGVIIDSKFKLEDTFIGKELSDEN